jgi:hypothetical protein
MRAAALVGSTAAALVVVTLSGCGQAAASPAIGTVDTSSHAAASVPAPAAPSDTPGSASGNAAPCAADQVTMTASTDRPTYPKGATVTLSTTLTNHSPQACSIALSAHNPAYSVSGSSGSVVWRTCGPGQSCPLYERQVVVPAGGTQTQTEPWTQHTCDASTCTGPPPPSGAYRGTASWGSLGSASAPFTVG